MSGEAVLQGRRLLVVGASSGIGAAVAKAGAAAGADVAVSARRADRLDALVAEMGRGHAFAGDASDRDDARRVVADAAAAMGGLDLVVYAAGYGVLQRLVDCDPGTWASVYAVNVIGANLIAGAAVEHLGRDGIVAFVSSRTVEDANAYFSAYGASKAALDHCIRTWRVEHPDRRFVRVTMGNCAPTEFPNHMGLDLLATALEAWGRQGIPSGMMDVDDVAEALIRSLAVGLAHPEIELPELKLDARRDTGIPFSDLDPTAPTSP